MSAPKPDIAVLWLSDVAISRVEFEREVSASFDSFGVQKSGSLQHAKYVFADDVWRSVSTFFDRHGAAIQRLIASGAIGPATLDIAFMSAAETVTRSAQIPAIIAAKVGQSSVDLVISTYPVDTD